MSNQRTQIVHKKPIISYLQKHKMGYEKAKAKLVQVEKGLCSTFHPHASYFNNHKPSYILNPTLTFFNTQKYQYKTNLSIPKQIQYIKGSTKDYMFEDSIMVQILKEQSQSRGLIQNTKCRSFICDNSLYYGFNNCFYKLGYEYEDGKMEVVQKYKILQTIQSILQVSQYIHNQLIIIRCKHSLLLYNIKQFMLVGQKQQQHEITSVSVSTNQQIYYNVYDHTHNTLYEWNVQEHIIQTIKTQPSFWPLLSHHFINRRECLCFNNISYSLVDTRTNYKQKCYQVKDLGDDRIYASIPLWNHQHPNNQIAISKKFCVDILDIRNMKDPIVSYQHHSQQSPPTCLQFSVLDQPTLIAYSTHYLGSVLYLPLQLNKSQQQYSLKSQQYRKRQGNSHFKLLFDSGKISQNLHPSSVCSTMLQGYNIVFQVDNCEGISVQAFRHQQGIFQYPHSVSHTSQFNNFEWFHDKLYKDVFENKKDKQYTNKNFVYAEVNKFYQKIMQNKSNQCTSKQEQQEDEQEQKIGSKQIRREQNVVMSLQTNFMSLGLSQVGRQPKNSLFDEHTINSHTQQSLEESWPI